MRNIGASATRLPRCTPRGGAARCGSRCRVKSRVANSGAETTESEWPIAAIIDDYHAKGGVGLREQTSEATHQTGGSVSVGDDDIAGNGRWPLLFRIVRCRPRAPYPKFGLAGPPETSSGLTGFTVLEETVTHHLEPDRVLRGLVILGERLSGVEGRINVARRHSAHMRLGSGQADPLKIKCGMCLLKRAQATGVRQSALGEKSQSVESWVSSARAPPDLIPVGPSR